MNPEIYGSARLLVLGAAAGATLMSLYDVLRALRVLIRHNWFAIGAEDLFYWIFSGFAVFYLLYLENDGALRFYVIGTVLAAMILYDRMISRHLYAFLLKWLKKAGRCFRI